MAPCGLASSGSRDLASPAPAARFARLLASEGLVSSAYLLHGMLLAQPLCNRHLPHANPGGFTAYEAAFPSTVVRSGVPVPVLSVGDMLGPGRPRSFSHLLSLTPSQGAVPATELLPGKLYLGHKGDASSLETLRRLGITHVLNCSEEVWLCGVALCYSPQTDWLGHSGR